MATLESICLKIQDLIDASNAITGSNSSDLTHAVNVLIEGYGVGGSTEYFRHLTFMDSDNETVLSTVSYSPRYSCYPSIAPTLTKESTIDTVYKHSGWSTTPGGDVNTSIFNNIIEDTVLYPVFEESVRMYTVRFWDGNKLCKTERVPYGGSSSYVYKKTGHYFKYWTPEPVNISSDMDCYGEWEMASFAKDGWDIISSNAKSGVASEYYRVGDEREMQVSYSTPIDGVSNEKLILKVAHIDSSGGMYIITYTPYRNLKMAYTSNYDRNPSDLYALNSYLTSDIFECLDDIFYSSLPEDMRYAIKYVQKQTISYFAYGEAWSSRPRSPRSILRPKPMRAARSRMRPSSP